MAGLGIGKEHVDGYKVLPELYEVVALCDISEPLARSLAEAYDVPRVETSIEALCAMDDLDVIDICTPPGLHAAQTKQVLASGKHAVVEKPVAASLKIVDELIAAEAQSGKRVMPIFQYRFGHGIQKLKLLQQAGLTGRAHLSTVETAWRRRADYFADRPWRGKRETELGGVVTVHAIHAHDLLYYILGPARLVSARMNTSVNPIELEDCFAASVEMTDGSLATLAATLGSSAQISRHRFCFSGLTAESNTAPYASTADPWTFVGDSPEIDRQIDEALEGFEPLPEGFAGQFYRFFHALQNGDDLPVTLADTRASMELLTALYYSARTGQSVALPIADDHPAYAGW